jgi:hypothetical protein
MCLKAWGWVAVVERSDPTECYGSGGSLRSTPGTQALNFQP